MHRKQLKKQNGRPGKNSDSARIQDGCAQGTECRTLKLLIRLGIGIAAVMLSLIPAFSDAVKNILQIAAFVTVGAEVIVFAIREALSGRLLNEMLLISAASVGALCIGAYFEAAAVMILFVGGKILKERAVWKAKQSMERLLDLRPETVLKKEGGEFVPVPPETVAVGDLVQVRPGDRIGLDGIVTEGTSYIDQSALTGAGIPRAVVPGDRLLSGCVNKNGLLEMRVTAQCSQSAAGRIFALACGTELPKSKTEQSVARFLRWYTLAVAGLAVLAAVLLPTLTKITYVQSVYTALDFLILSCPCALEISAPLAYFMGRGAAARRGLLVKGGNFLEALDHVETAALGKTGTLTEGRFSVTKCVCADGISQEVLIELAAAAEAGSVHPIAEAILAANGGRADTSWVTASEEVTGSGIVAQTVRGELRIGTRRLLNEAGVSFLPPQESGTAVYAALDGRYLGCILLTDPVKKTAAKAISSLKKCGVKRILMLTGDNGQNAARIAERLGITEVRGGLLPDEKADVMRELIVRRAPSGRVAFIGDGSSDAPAIAISDIGIATNALGSDAAIDAADAILLREDVSYVAEGMRISALTRRIVIENSGLFFTVQLALLLLAVAGKLLMIAAMMADIVVTMLAVANTMRLYASGKKKG